MSGQMHMANMNRQLMGQTQTPEVRQGFGTMPELNSLPQADTLWQSAMLQEAAGVQPEQPNRPQTRTLNLREQAIVFGGIAPEAVEQVGPIVRSPQSELGKSGTIFDGHQFSTDRKLQRLRQENHTSQKRPEVAADAPTTQIQIEERRFDEQIKQLEREIALQSRRTETKASGRATLTNSQTKQSRVKGGKSGLSLREKVLRGIGLDIQRQTAAELYRKRQAQKATQPKGPGAFLEGGADRKTSMVEQLRTIEQADAQHELSTGE